MNKKIKLLGILMTVSFLCCYAQTKEFDPSLAPNVTIVSRNLRRNGTVAICGIRDNWLLSTSNNVPVSQKSVVSMYPGKFFAKNNHVWFRKEVRLKKESSLCWEGPSDIVLYINGVKQSVSGKQVILPVGRSSLLFEVTTDDSLPCIILKGAGLENPDEWQVSMDKEHWTIPESAVMYNKPGVLPDAPQDMTARIKPSQILPMRNAEMQGKDGISIGKNGYVLIDFFHLEIGTLTFQAKGKGTITVRVGETPEEALERDDKKLEQYPLAPVTLSEEGGTITLPERALRYVSLECDKGAEITSLRFDASLWPVEHQMQFETDDDYVNNLFKMSSATLHTSMHRFYLDGVKRDFLPWSMDALVSTLAGDYLFGDQQVSKNGISIALMPLDPQKSDIGIPDYPLHALFGLKQNYLRFGDLTTSLQYKDRIIQLLDFMPPSWMRMVLYTAIMETDSSVIPPDGPLITVLPGKGWRPMPRSCSIIIM